MPSEGASIVFPGRMMHESDYGYEQEFGDVPTFEEFKTFRVSIAVDYTITFNRHQGKAMGLQPVNNWRIFDEAYNAPGIR
jgi:diadenosine tetraphosphatase ApaH/serine/threonine PP2A family protein phosphatase